MGERCAMRRVLYLAVLALGLLNAGCIGALRLRSQCDTEYRSCVFEQVGANWPALCPNP